MVGIDWSGSTCCQILNRACHMPAECRRGGRLPPLDTQGLSLSGRSVTNVEGPSDRRSAATVSNSAIKSKLLTQL
jgi:hypothetical protein